jgi:tetratricopeptide (TPR) repeat protein
LLARDDEDPSKLADDWQSDPTRLLGDPMQTEHTLEWLFKRSVRGLDETAQQALAAAGLLARAPFPIAAIEAALLLPLSRIGGEGRSERAISVREALKQLIDRGLLRRSGEDDHRECTHVLGYRFARNESSSDAGLRNGLAGWLHERLSAALTVGANSTDGLADLLQHAAALLRTDYDQQLWHPLAIFLLYKGQDRLVSLGRLDWVNASLGAVNDWLDRFPAAKADEPFWQRQRSVCFNRIGDLARAQGNLSEAQRLFGESLRIRQRLAESDPANAAWQRDLAVSFNKLGELATAQRNLPEAQRLFDESLHIRQRLAESDPANAEWQRDLSYSLTIIGQLLMRRERWEEALPLLEQSLAIDERLATLAPTNVLFQDDVAVSRRLVDETRQKAKGGRRDS